MKQPILRPVPKDELYEVTRDFKIQADGVTICVPRYFRYDGASIPVIAWQIIHSPFNPMVMGPALIHDWLYYNHQVDRKTADGIFFDLLGENGMSEGKRFAMWAAVRAAGDAYWDNDSEDIDELVRICQKVKDSSNFSDYHFPDEVIQKCCP